MALQGGLSTGHPSISILESKRQEIGRPAGSMVGATHSTRHQVKQGENGLAYSLQLNGSLNFDAVKRNGGEGSA